MPKQYSVNISIQVKTTASLQGEGLKAGKSRKKGWFQRVFVGTVPQRGRQGAFALVEKVMKRVGFGDWYSEKITDEATGEIIHQCEEPLSKHQGHGSDRQKSPNVEK